MVIQRWNMVTEQSNIEIGLLYCKCFIGLVCFIKQDGTTGCIARGHSIWWYQVISTLVHVQRIEKHITKAFFTTVFVWVVHFSEHCLGATVCLKCRSKFVRQIRSIWFMWTWFFVDFLGHLPKKNFPPSHVLVTFPGGLPRHDSHWIF